MVVVHANDPTTRFLSKLYELREDVTCLITESNTNSDVIRKIREADKVMMLGHGTEDGLFSITKEGKTKRLMIYNRHVGFLRNKECIGIWCYANKFAEEYKLHGLFSGMIISELDEAQEKDVSTTQEEIDREMIKFVIRLRDCIARYGLKETPQRMKELDDVKSELTRFNYSNLFYYE